MRRLQLTHLTLVGANVLPASVSFGPRTTIIHGPSDTGKSFIVDAIDFALGKGSALKEVPELNGYSTVLLGLNLEDVGLVTLARPISGGRIGVYDGDVRVLPAASAPTVLGVKHHPTSNDNVSAYLLDHLLLRNRRVRKNSRGETDDLSFRNLVHLCVVDETQMQAETSPALTGNHVTQTKEISVLRLLLEDDDDSNIVPVERPTEKRRLGAARVEVVDRLMAELDERLSQTPTAEELQEQLERLERSVFEATGSIKSLRDSRSAIASEAGILERERLRMTNRVAELSALTARFALLASQYDSDLDRLAMVREAGSLLGYFRSGQCVFCGAEQAHQHFNTTCEGDTTSFAKAIDAETQKTINLRADLSMAAEDLRQELARVRSARDQSAAAIDTLEPQLDRIENLLREHNDDLKLLLDTRSKVEKSLGLYDQVASLAALRASLLSEVDAGSALAAGRFDLGALRDFSAEMTRCLAAWGVPEASSVRYDRNEQDLVAGDQVRSAHGKGVRAILHAAFTLGLAQYCVSRELPHPGFVVLDSPLVTYRPPDEVDGDPLVQRAVADRFYADVQDRLACQVIVMENVDPPLELDDSTVDVAFTKSEREGGRYGFFAPGRFRESTTLF